MKQPSKLLQSCNIALITLFLFYYAGATLFPHTHQVNGIKVIHSHPYTSSSNHTHSSSALQTIDLLTTLCFIVAMASITPKLFAKKRVVFYQKGEGTLRLSPLTILLRGPPKS